MQITMTVAATRVQILQKNNWTQTQEPSPVAVEKQTPKDDDPACIS
jgi:type II secretory pathway component PulC